MNGDLRGAIWDFLMSPRDLTVPFLWVLSSVFCLGALVALEGSRRVEMRLRAASRNYEDPAERLHVMFDVEPYLRQQARLGNLISCLDAIGPMLLTIGILGTFLGLGIAVGRATESLRNPETSIVALQELLRVVSFKFQTSAWGVILSLLFTAVIRVPTEVFGENAIARRIPGLMRFRRTPDQVLAQTIGDAIQSALGAHLTATLASVGDAADGLRRAADGIRAETESLNKTVGGSAAASKGAAETLATAALSLGQLDKNVSRAVEGVGPVLERALRASNEASAAKLQAMTEVITRGLANMEKSLSDAQEKQTHAATQSQLGVTKALESLGASTKTLEGTLGDSMGQLKEHQAKTTAVVKDLRDVLAGFRTALEELVRLTDKARADVASEQMKELMHGHGSGGTLGAPRPATRTSTGARVPPSGSARRGDEVASPSGERDDDSYF